MRLLDLASVGRGRSTSEPLLVARPFREDALHGDGFTVQAGERVLWERLDGSAYQLVLATDRIPLLSVSTAFEAQTFSDAHLTETR